MFLAGIQEFQVTLWMPAFAGMTDSCRHNRTIWVGVTSDLVKRIWEHKSNLVEGFTKRYGIHQLVWYELHDTMESAIEREKRLKE